MNYEDIEGFNPREGLELSDSDILGIIEKSGYSIKIIPPKDYGLTEEYDLSAVTNEKDREFVGNILSAMEEYVNLPIIEDSYKSHAKRAIRKQNLLDEVKNTYGSGASERVNNFLNRNKLTGNSIAVVYPALKLFHEIAPTFDVQSDVFTHLDNALNIIKENFFGIDRYAGNKTSSHSRWKKLSKTERRNVVESLTQDLVAILKSFEESN